MRAGALAARGEWISFIDSDLDLDPGVDPVLPRDRATRAAPLRDRLEAPSRIDRPLPALATRRELVLPAAEPRPVPARRARHPGRASRSSTVTIAEQVMPLLLVKQFAFDLELLAVSRALGYDRVRELPVTLDYRFTGSGVRSARGREGAHRHGRDLLPPAHPAHVPAQAGHCSAIDARSAGGAASAAREPDRRRRGDRRPARLPARRGRRRRRRRRTPCGGLGGDLVAVLPAGQPTCRELAVGLRRVLRPAAGGGRRRAGDGAARTARLARSRRRRCSSRGSVQARAASAGARGTSARVVDYPAESIVVRRDDYLAALEAGVEPERLVAWLAARGREVVYTPEAMTVVPPAPVFGPHLASVRRVRALPGRRPRAPRGGRSLSMLRLLTLLPFALASGGDPARRRRGNRRARSASRWRSSTSPPCSSPRVTGALRFRSLRVGAAGAAGAGGEPRGLRGGLRPRCASRPMTTRTLSVVIPAYNAEASIGRDDRRARRRARARAVVRRRGRRRRRRLDRRTRRRPRPPPREPRAAPRRLPAEPRTLRGAARRSRGRRRATGCSCSTVASRSTRAALAFVAERLDAGDDVWNGARPRSTTAATRYAAFWSLLARARLGRLLRPARAPRASAPRTSTATRRGRRASSRPGDAAPARASTPFGAGTRPAAGERRHAADLAGSPSGAESTSRRRTRCDTSRGRRSARSSGTRSIAAWCSSTVTDGRSRAVPGRRRLLPALAGVALRCRSTPAFLSPALRSRQLGRSVRSVSPRPRDARDRGRSRLLSPSMPPRTAPACGAGSWRCRAQRLIASPSLTASTRRVSGSLDGCRVGRTTSSSRASTASAPRSTALRGVASATTARRRTRSEHRARASGRLVDERAAGGRDRVDETRNGVADRRRPERRRLAHVESPPFAHRRRDEDMCARDAARSRSALDSRPRNSTPSGAPSATDAAARARRRSSRAVASGRPPEPLERRDRIARTLHAARGVRGRRPSVGPPWSSIGTCDVVHPLRHDGDVTPAVVTAERLCAALATPSSPGHRDTPRSHHGSRTYRPTSGDRQRRLVEPHLARQLVNQRDDRRAAHPPRCQERPGVDLVDDDVERGAVRLVSRSAEPRGRRRAVRRARTHRDTASTLLAGRPST